MLEFFAFVGIVCCVIALIVGITLLSKFIYESCINSRRHRIKVIATYRRDYPDMHLSAEGYLNGGIYEVDVNRRVKDIGNLAVISAEKAASIIRKARKVVNKHLDKALKEAQGDI